MLQLLRVRPGGTRNNCSIVHRSHRDAWGGNAEGPGRSAEPLVQCGDGTRYAFAFIVSWVLSRRNTTPASRPPTSGAST